MVARGPGRSRRRRRPGRGLAFAEHGAGRRDEAARHLKDVAARQGPQFAHAGALGLILLELGLKDEARTWLARSRLGEPEHAEARRALATLGSARR